MTRPSYSKSVFINLPFDDGYKPLFNAVVFAVCDCGFTPRCTRESDDATEVRLQRIYGLIAQSKYGIHDLSRTGPDPENRLPRFNMPLELGIFLGAKRYGARNHQAKRGLILDREQYRYQKFCSDIAGLDPKAHQCRAEMAIQCVRDWLRGIPDIRDVRLPSASTINERYRAFRKELPTYCRKFELDHRELHFNDFVTLIVGWLRIRT